MVQEFWAVSSRRIPDNTREEVEKLHIPNPRPPPRVLSRVRGASWRGRRRLCLPSACLLSNILPASVLSSPKPRPSHALAPPQHRHPSRSRVETCPLPRSRPPSSDPTMHRRRSSSAAMCNSVVIALYLSKNGGQNQLLVFVSSLIVFHVCACVLLLALIYNISLCTEQ